MLYAKKSLGQHFMKHRSVLLSMTTAGEVQKGDTVLEIGPGEGSLTEILLSTGAKVIAIEKDMRAIPLLKTRFTEEIKNKQLTLVHEDILRFKITLLPKSYKLIANIPYYITGEILRLFLSAERKPSLIVLMLQKEVAKRIVSSDKKESILSLSIKCYGRPRIIRTVSRNLFVPPPKVDSAILVIQDISSPFKTAFQEKRFFELLHKGFAHKRKKLSSNLKSFAKNLVSENISDNARAEDISLNQWISLSKN